MPCPVPVVVKPVASHTGSTATDFVDSAASASSGEQSSTPETSPGSSSSVSVSCAVCSQNIIEGKEDALFCEGSCNQWCHRYCVGVPLKLFQTLSASPSPFVCSICSQANSEREYTELKSSVELLTEENKAEILILKDLPQPVNSYKICHSWSYSPVFW